jgi:hypothetical protein
MTPKEKAEELWMKMFQKQIEITENGDGNLCVEMALIAVDEILDIVKHIDVDSEDYWEEVRQEIINL